MNKCLTSLSTAAELRLAKVTQCNESQPALLGLRLQTTLPYGHGMKASHAFANAKSASQAS